MVVVSGEQRVRGPLLYARAAGILSPVATGSSGNGIRTARKRQCRAGNRSSKWQARGVFASNGRRAGNATTKKRRAAAASRSRKTRRPGARAGEGHGASTGLGQEPDCASPRDLALRRGRDLSLWPVVSRQARDQQPMPPFPAIEQAGRCTGRTRRRGPRPKKRAFVPTPRSKHHH